MREAPAIPIIEALLEAGASGAGLRSRGDERRAATSSARASTYADKSYDALEGADALVIVTEWNEFREPDFEQDQEADEDAGDLRRPQHLQPGAAARRWASRTLDRPSMSAVLVTGGAGYIGSHAVKALRARRAATSSIYDNLQRGTPRPRRTPPAAAARSAGTSRRRAGSREVLRAHGVGAVMHFAAWLSVGESVKDPVGYYREQRRGTLTVLRAMVEAGVTHFVFSSTCATFGEPLETPINESHPQRPINAYGETKLAIERALPHFERAYGIRVGRRCAISTPPAPIPTGALGEDHHPEMHVIPARHRRGPRAATPSRIFGDDYPTPDGTCLRDYVHVADLAAAHAAGARIACARAGRRRPTIWATARPISVREVVDSVERVTGRAVPARPGPRRPGDPARALCVERADPQRARLDAPTTRTST